MNLGGVIHLNKTRLCVICGFLLMVLLYLKMPDYKYEPTKEEGKLNLKNLLQLAIKAAENGGLEVVSNRDKLLVQSKGLTKEGMEDSVTTADYLSHCSIMGTLKHTHPHLNVISEEAKTECEQSQQIDHSEYVDPVIGNLQDVWVDKGDVTVWIDPLDATHEYTEKLYEYVTTMVCVAIKGKPVIGVVHKPFPPENPQTSWIWVDKAKSANLQTTKSTNEKLKIIISRSHSGEVKKVLDGSFSDYELVIAAGAGYKALEVATGKVDAYVHITAIKKWDICAGNAIVNGMGGNMTTKFNEVIDYADTTTVQNDRGLVATLKKHDLFIGKL